MSPQPSSVEITRLLVEWTAGRREPAPELWARVYPELRRIASAYMRNVRPDHTLQTTALVNEAYLRMFEGQPFQWENRKHFFCAMALIMRRILVDHARGHCAQKRGGEWQKLGLDTTLPLSCEAPEDLLALHEALEQLAKRRLRQAQVVDLRCFAGLTVDETAAILSISAETVKLDWRFARAWLQRQMGPRQKT